MSANKNTVWTFIAIVIIAPFFVFGIVSWCESKFQRLPVLGEKRHTIQNFSLVNQEGENQTLNDWEGKIVVANYFFTHCPVVCPKMTYNLKRVQQYAAIDNMAIYSFSVDPESDSVQQLKKYATQFNIQNNWHLLTGNKKELYALARKSFLLVATDGDGGTNDFIHSDKLVLIDKQKRIRGYYNGTDEEATNQLIKDIQKLSKE